MGLVITIHRGYLDTTLLKAPGVADNIASSCLPAKPERPEAVARSSTRPMPAGYSRTRLHLEVAGCLPKGTGLLR